MKNPTKFAFTLIAIAATVVGCAHRRDHLSGNDQAHVVTPPNGYPLGEMDTDQGHRERVGLINGEEPGRVASTAASMKKTSSKMAAEAPAFVNHMTEAEALNRLHHANQMEISMADLAESKAKSEALIANARQTKTEQQKRADEIKTLAEKRKIKLESFQLATYEVAVRNELAALKDTAFDTAYYAALVRAHREAAHDLQVARNEARNSEVQKLIRSCLPELTAQVAPPVRSAEPKERASAE